MCWKQIQERGKIKKLEEKVHPFDIRGSKYINIPCARVYVHVGLSVCAWIMSYGWVYLHKYNIIKFENDLLFHHSGV